MASPDETLAAFGLEQLLKVVGFTRGPHHSLVDGTGRRIAGAPREFVRSFRFVLEKEMPGTWKIVSKASGRTCGRAIATHLDAELARLGRDSLSALPLEACLVLLAHYFALHGWGRLELDLADAGEHGLVVARLHNSPFVAALADVNEFVDPQAAGVLQGFFEYVSGEALGCDEIACARRGAPCCTFVITAQERLDAVVSLHGRESAETILARLKT